MYFNRIFDILIVVIVGLLFIIASFRLPSSFILKQRYGFIIDDDDKYVKLIRKNHFITGVYIIFFGFIFPVISNNSLLTMLLSMGVISIFRINLFYNLRKEFGTNKL